LRQDRDQSVLVALNFGRRPVKFALGGEVRRTEWELLLSNKRSGLGSITGKTLLPLEGHEVLILKQK